MLTKCLGIFYNLYPPPCTFFFSQNLYVKLVEMLTKCLGIFHNLYPPPPHSFVLKIFDVKLVKMLTMISVFLFCWTPYAILSILGILEYGEVSHLSFIFNLKRTDSLILLFSVFFFCRFSLLIFQACGFFLKKLLLRRKTSQIAATEALLTQIFPRSTF
jgi:hypothetical protein